LMNGMLEKGKKEKHEEQVQFAAYKQFCSDTTAEKKLSIDDAEERIAQPEAVRELERFSVSVVEGAIVAGIRAPRHIALASSMSDAG